MLTFQLESQEVNLSHWSMNVAMERSLKSPFWWRYCLKVDRRDKLTNQTNNWLYELGDENVSPPAPSVHIFRAIDLSDSSHHKALHYGPLISTVHGKG